MPIFCVVHGCGGRAVSHAIVGDPRGASSPPVRLDARSRPPAASAGLVAAAAAAAGPAASSMHATDKVLSPHPPLSRRRRRCCTPVPRTAGLFCDVHPDGALPGRGASLSTASKQTLEGTSATCEASRKQITCACSTEHCLAQNTTRCNTTSMCYTQYLQTSDGSDPRKQGCINSKTPLLCENRRPAVHSAARWPHLVCCSQNLCNLNVLLAPPGKLDRVRDPVSQPDLQPGMPGLTPSNNSGLSSGEPTTTAPPPSQRLLSPVFLAVLAVGVGSLAVVALAVLAVLRRHAGLLGTRYVNRSSYLKGRRQTTNDDPTALSLPLPNGGTYDNKLAVVS
ncbi:hypothetical protein IscW_ISCW003240 [Ixodes scapularis]|uniref:Activin types I and II receptor domain-containing protein n=1 Tax=Ixodes scapularis TaxID=6945 RepID=B7PBM8_IXOSC|nr:hypothetical protein IscW_ISCW003240 [Ixodes scapularis]|eukprot:XP_002408568.1 hypothetical protein IscW_ISCW003240 [Ixodes scapularis]